MTHRFFGAAFFWPACLLLRRIWRRTRWTPILFALGSDPGGQLTDKMLAADTYAEKVSNLASAMAWLATQLRWAGGWEKSRFECEPISLPIHSKCVVSGCGKGRFWGRHVSIFLPT